MKSIKATNFYEFIKCPRKVYLYFFGDPEKRLPYSEFLQEKFQEGRDYEKKVASKLKFKQPAEELSFQEAAEQTLKFMKNREKMIYQGVLIDDNLIGIPDFLELQKGKSELGNFYYQVVDVKTGMSAKQEYIMQVMFYSYLLKKIQGFMPPKAYLVLRDKSRVEIDVQEHFNKFSGILKRVKEMSEGSEEDVHIASVCKECVWRGICFEKAEKEKNISLIYNIGRQKIETLKNLGVKNLDDISRIDAEELAKVKGLSKDSLERWKLQAQSLLQRKAIRFQPHKFPKDKPIYFDIEDTEVRGKKVIYLYGLITGDKYIYFVAKNPKDEKKLFKKFLEYFKDKENFKLYVYSGHEKAMLKKLFGKYGGDEAVYKKINENIIDLLKAIKDAAVLPIYSYSIKDVAKHLGFKWTAEDAGGAQSMIWYDRWLETKSKKYLDEVLRYNKEDCKAMVVVKKWIEKA